MFVFAKYIITLSDIFDNKLWDSVAYHTYFPLTKPLFQHVLLYVCLSCRYEMELSLRNSVEADVSGLRKALEDLNMQSQDLEIQVRCLQEELLQLKKNHEEVMQKEKFISTIFFK